jgi:hypothetical protein
MRCRTATRRGHFAGALFTLAALAATWPEGDALAHGFGQRYDLPVPLWLYLTGAAAAVGLSFLLLAIFAREAGGHHGYPRIDLLRWRLARAFAHRYVLSCVRALAPVS